MHINDYDYNLPPELIATHPLEERDACRLLCLDRASDKTENFITHRTFRDVLKILRKGDRLVFNDTRVIPARVFCRKSTGAAVELFFTERVNDRSWRALVKPGKRAPVGTILFVGGAGDGVDGVDNADYVDIIDDDNLRIKIRVDEILDDGYERVVSLVDDDERGDNHNNNHKNIINNNDDNNNHINNNIINDNHKKNITLDDVIEQFGHMPLPHYMEREDNESDRELYQTVYAKRSGAVAAPTAGLHFTDKLLDELAQLGIDKTFVTLHVGIGTFRPVSVDDPRDHDIHEERFELSEIAAREINETWQRGGRVIAVGTTVVRTLESCAVSHHKVIAKNEKTKLMILPPYDFKAVDGLITNFHLPKSTLLMLVSAFSSREKILAAYQEAIKEKYRFFSYGDAMLLL